MLTFTLTISFLWLVAQSCLTLCDPMGCSPPCSSVCGILQDRILELVAVSFSRASPSWPHTIYLDSWTSHSRFLCNIALYSIGLYFCHQSHPQEGVVFLWLHVFILSGIISPLISSSILATYCPGDFIFQCPIFLPFDTVHGVLKARILKWFAIPFSSGPHFARVLHHDPSFLGGPTWHGS